MGTERARVNFTVAKNTYQISGNKAFYSDGTVKKNTGATLATEKTSGSTSSGVVITGENAKRVLVKLRAVYTGNGVAGVGNQAQSDKTKSFDFYCDPDKAEDAIVNLPNKVINGRNILRVYRPLRRCYV